VPLQSETIARAPRTMMKGNRFQVERYGESCRKCLHAADDALNGKTWIPLTQKVVPHFHEIPKTGELIVLYPL
jgi:hypothetical protein